MNPQSQREYGEVETEDSDPAESSVAPLARPAEDLLKTPTEGMNMTKAVLPFSRESAEPPRDD